MPTDHSCSSGLASSPDLGWKGPAGILARGETKRKPEMLGLEVNWKNSLEIMRGTPGGVSCWELQWIPQSLEKKAPYGNWWGIPRWSACQRVLLPSQRCCPASRGTLVQAVAGRHMAVCGSSPLNQAGSKAVTQTQVQRLNYVPFPGYQLHGWRLLGGGFWTWPGMGILMPELTLWRDPSQLWKKTYNSWKNPLSGFPQNPNVTSIGRHYFSQKSEYSGSISGSFC